jgi:diguanylate cyclase (GGDEF)-like protein/PAS domain S-box-containing protein
VSDNTSQRRFIDSVIHRLHGLSIKQLTSLVVKLVVLGFALLLITYMATSKVTAYYQDLVSDQVLPMTVLERDFGGRLVEYALIQDQIIKSKSLISHKASINVLNSETNIILTKLQPFVRSDSGLLGIKERLDKRHATLAKSVLNIDSLHLSQLQISDGLAVFKKDIHLILESLIVLREELSGKVAWVAAKNRHQITALITNLVQADLLLGLKMSGLATNVSVLLYVDNIDQFSDLNINQLSQNIKEVDKALNALQNLTKQVESLVAIDGISKKISSTVQELGFKLSGPASLEPIIKEKFSLEASLAEGSLEIKKTLSLIEEDLRKMSDVSNSMVSQVIAKNERIAWITTAVFITLSLLFVSILVVVISAIARQINTPIDLLNNTMRRLTQGDLSARLAIDDSVSAEFSDLWRDFNVFADKNEEMIQEHELIFDNADVGIAWLKDRKYLKLNKKILEIFGYKEDEMLGQSSRIIYRHEDDFLEVGKEGYEILKSGKTFSREFEMLRADGSPFWGKIIGKSIDDTVRKNSIWLFEDVSERKAADEKLYQLANFDALTQLANRSLFNIYLDEAIAKSKRHGKEFALLFVDIDRFKHINDSLGHEAGDRVLTEVSARVKSVLRESDILARLGGDEFTVILDDISDISAVEAVAKKILDEFNKPIIYKEKEVLTGCSIGISRYPKNGVIRSELLSSADSAMYYAKQSGRNRYSLYSDDIGESTNKYIQLSQALKKAVEHNEFELHYQPKIDMRTRDIVGAEALIRWRKPGEGLISPFDFIPVLEEMGLMVQVGEWVIFEACKAVKAWVELGYNPGKIAVNLSERQFGSDSLLDSIERALEETSIRPCNIEFEITESLMMSDSKLTMKILEGIKSLGMDIAMDDFGTGYSSLAYLKIFPIDILKIDRAFVMDITEDPDDAAIVDAIIAMAKQLKLTTVAEGIETEEQYEFLCDRGCEIGQGYLFSKPVPFDEMLKLYENNSSLEMLSSK